MVCEKGALEQNLAFTARSIAEATGWDVDILAFPETSLSGYANPQLYPYAVIGLDSPTVHQLLAMTRGKSITVLVGILEKNPHSKPFITQLVARNGSLIGVQRKMTAGAEQSGQLEDWHTIGSTVNIFKHGTMPFGIAICADMDNPHVFAACARQKAQIVFELAAPGLYGEQATRNWAAGFTWWKSEVEKTMAPYAQQYDYWIACATQAGRTVDEDFPGGAFVFAPGGECVFAAPDGSPGTIYLEVDVQGGRVVQLKCN